MFANLRFDAADAWSRRDIDMAIGVLITLRRCSERQAFNEIADAVARTGVGLHSISRALVLLATGTTAAFDHRREAFEMWGDLLGDCREVRARAV